MPRPVPTGSGIDIGALDAPTTLPAGASVRYRSPERRGRIRRASTCRRRFRPIGRPIGYLDVYGTPYRRTAAAAAEASQWFEVVPVGMNTRQDPLVLRRPA
jgi:hypothetical protein